MHIYAHVVIYRFMICNLVKLIWKSELYCMVDFYQKEACRVKRYYDDDDDCAVI